MNNDLKSCEALKAYAREVLCGDNPTNSLLIRMFDEIIENAPPVKFSLMPADESKDEAYMRGYKHGMIEGLLKRPQGKGFWVKEENEGYCFDCQTGDLVVRVRYHCSKCGGSGDNKDKFCKHCGAKMKGGAE